MLAQADDTVKPASRKLVAHETVAENTVAEKSIPGIPSIVKHFCGAITTAFPFLTSGSSDANALITQGKRATRRLDRSLAASVQAACRYSPTAIA
jgi:hypothetical protein